MTNWSFLLNIADRETETQRQKWPVCGHFVISCSSDTRATSSTNMYWTFTLNQAPDTQTGVWGFMKPGERDIPASNRAVSRQAKPRVASIYRRQHRNSVNRRLLSTRESTAEELNRRKGEAWVFQTERNTWKLEEGEDAGENSVLAKVRGCWLFYLLSPSFKLAKCLSPESALTKKIMYPRAGTSNW